MRPSMSRGLAGLSFAGGALLVAAEFSSRLGPYGSTTHTLASFAGLICVLEARFWLRTSFTNGIVRTSMSEPKFALALCLAGSLTILASLACAYLTVTGVPVALIATIALAANTFSIVSTLSTLSRITPWDFVLVAVGAIDTVGIRMGRTARSTVLYFTGDARRMTALNIGFILLYCYLTGLTVWEIGEGMNLLGAANLFNLTILSLLYYPNLRRHAKAMDQAEEQPDTTLTASEFLAILLPRFQTAVVLPFVLVGIAMNPLDPGTLAMTTWVAFTACLWAVHDPGPGGTRTLTKDVRRLARTLVPAPPAPALG